MTTSFTELSERQPLPKQLSKRIKSGELLIARKLLQRLDLFEEMRDISFEAIRRVAGAKVADDIARDGLEYIHRHAEIEQIAEITDVIYELARTKTKYWASSIASLLLDGQKSFYFEKSPNIRFITPYDYMVKGLKKLEKFAKDHGGGKMTPHPPHRDSWVDCPDNLINVWIALGPIPSGNGLTIYPDVFGRELTRMPNGSVGYQENPGEPTYTDLEPGDAILFDGEQLHSTVLNHLDTTRHVISFRIIDTKPNYPNGHYHHYLHSGLAGGPLNAFAEIPANLSWGWFSTRLRWVAEKTGLRSRPTMPRDWKKHAVAGDNLSTFKLPTMPINTIKAVNDSVCVARIGDDKVVAFQRRCPHDGADFSLGTVHEGQIVCPWHTLPFSSETGQSPCKALRALRFFKTEVSEDIVTIQLGQQSGVSQ
jgi:nitrite reductase/ring-hydroxylating ferredoxin subunit